MWKNPFHIHAIYSHSQTYRFHDGLPIKSYRFHKGLLIKTYRFHKGLLIKTYIFHKGLHVPIQKHNRFLKNKNKTCKITTLKTK
jgi:hypothetical protein